MVDELFKQNDALRRVLRQERVNAKLNPRAGCSMTLYLGLLSHPNCKLDQIEARASGWGSGFHNSYPFQRPTGESERQPLILHPP